MLVARTSLGTFFDFWSWLCGRGIHRLQAKRVEGVIREINVVQVFLRNFAHVECSIFDAMFRLCVFPARKTRQKKSVQHQKMTMIAAFLRKARRFND